MPEILLLDRAKLRAQLEKKKLLDVKAAADGRFIVPVPDFKDGLGPILTPNIKEIEARIRGTEGKVSYIELEAGPQKIPADGTNVIVINRVDEFAQLAFKAKLERLIDQANGAFTRAVLDDFMSYARGYSYDAQSGKIHFSRNIGFRNDVYNMPISEFKKRYMRVHLPHLDLDDVADGNIRPGYYVKKPLLSRGLFLEGAFKVNVSEGSGDTVQEFDTGAMVNIPNDPGLPISFIHQTDINTCYTHTNGYPLVTQKGHSLPIFKLDSIVSKSNDLARSFPKNRK